MHYWWTMSSSWNWRCKFNVWVEIRNDWKCILSDSMSPIIRKMTKLLTLRLSYLFIGSQMSNNGHLISIDFISLSGSNNWVDKYNRGFTTENKENMIVDVIVWIYNEMKKIEWRNKFVIAIYGIVFTRQVDMFLASPKGRINFEFNMKLRVQKSLTKI